MWRSHWRLYSFLRGPKKTTSSGWVLYDVCMWCQCHHNNVVRFAKFKGCKTHMAKMVIKSKMRRRGSSGDGVLVLYRCSNQITNRSSELQPFEHSCKAPHGPCLCQSRFFLARGKINMVGTYRVFQIRAVSTHRTYDSFMCSSLGTDRLGHLLLSFFGQDFTGILNVWNPVSSKLTTWEGRKRWAA